MADGTQGIWLDPAAPESDVIASSRVRLARNIAGVPFVNRASNADRLRVLATIRRAQVPEPLRWVDLSAANPRERALLVERHLISRQFAEGDAPRGVGISSDEAVSVMVNEEDHLRLQVVLPGQQLASALQRANVLDDAIENAVDYTFSRRFGYLTACPTNVGCGIRFSIMAHLPALRMSEEIERFKRAAKELNLAVRGFYGEGSENAGDFYQISNQVTLGVSEDDLLETFQQQVVKTLVEYERSARELLMQEQQTSLEDRLFRALAVLRSARLLGVDEAMKLLSRVRLGVLMGRIEGVKLATLNWLLLAIQPAHLQALLDQELDVDELREARADLVRRRLAEGCAEHGAEPGTGTGMN